MTEINKRIELKLSPRTYLRDMYSAHNTVDEAFETGKRVQLFHDQEQICQLFPQPLDDKELRERVHNTLKYTVAGDSDLVTDHILALLQPKIEEVKARALEAGKLLGAKEERERIINLMDEALEEFDDGIRVANFVALLQHLRRQALKGGE